MEFGQILASVYDAGVWLTGADCCSSGWREVGRFPGERWRHRWDVYEIGLFMSFFLLIFPSNLCEKFTFIFKLVTFINALPVVQVSIHLLNC